MTRRHPHSPDTASLRRRLTLGGLLLVALAAGGVHRLNREPAARLVPEARAAEGVAFAPPAESAIPDGPDGAAIRRGMALFDNPREGGAAAYVGNGLACRNCHLDGGRRPFAAPMWGAWGVYPKYRAKNDAIVTMEARIRDCFLYSMNAPASSSGGPPPLGSSLYADLQAYFHWLATGAPTGRTLPGAGMRVVPQPAQGYDRERGKALYGAHCAACHGANGEGMRGEGEGYLIPPLWGAHSYNWGAGMARLDRAAGFIQANMPQGEENSLSDQQAWDVAAWIDSQPRPRDPRETDSVAETAKAHHAGEPTFYGQNVDGHLLGAGPD